MPLPSDHWAIAEKLSDAVARRCDVLPDSEPPVCQHCKQYGFECTFFLPITETRFKKKKLEEEAAAAAEKEKETERRTSSPLAEQVKPPDPKVYGEQRRFNICVTPSRAV